MGMGTRIAMAASLAVLAAGTALAAPSFTAEAVHTQPGQPSETGLVHVSDQGTRFEFQRHEQPMVQIALPAQGILRVLFPKDRTYFEIHTTAVPGPASARPETPCPPPGPAVSCVKVRTGTIGETAVDVWWIGPVAPVASPPATPGGPPTYPAPPKATTQVWWDPVRRQAVKETFPDRSASTMTRTGTETVEGRTVERWETRFTAADGQTTRYVRLHDPDLATDIHEEFPDGTVRAFRKIRLLPPDPAWYAVPDGYRQIDPPPRPGPGPSVPPASNQPPTSR